MKIYDEIIEKLMAHFTSGDYSVEVAEAKEQFFEQAGIFDEEDPGFEMKMAQFMDWYLFTRNLKKSGIPPIKRAMQSGSGVVIPQSKLKFYKSLAASRHSLFQLLKFNDQGLLIYDLFSDYKLLITDSPFSEGFRKNEIFEARVIPHGDNFIFAGAFCFHPPEATRFIQKEVKKIKKQIKKYDPDKKDKAREDLIARLFRMRHKHDQYSHMDVNDIYSNNSKLGL